MCRYLFIIHIYFRSLCVWCKLTDDAQVDDVWNLSYMSSTSFKWLLLTMNVTFEHIIVSKLYCL